MQLVICNFTAKVADVARLYVQIVTLQEQSLRGLDLSSGDWPLASRRTKEEVNVAKEAITNLRARYKAVRAHEKDK